MQGDGSDIEEAGQAAGAASSISACSSRRVWLGVSIASLFHLAWAQVLAATSGQQRVVFGTVLLGRMQGGAGADRALGVFINTLPLRVDVDAKARARRCNATHARLSALLGHEHASLALAQRCSGVAAPAPLFSACSTTGTATTSRNTFPSATPGRASKTLANEERTNYPLTLNVDDLGTACD